MDTPGIAVRPIRSIDGRAELTEVFLDNVRVPRENLIGEPGLGWTYAKYLLEKERTASAFLYFNQRQFEKAKSIARVVRQDGSRLIDTPAFSRELARVGADLMALEWSVLRVLAQDKNKYDLNAVVSALKVRGSEMQQRVSGLMVDALGPLALRYFERGPLSDSGTENWPEAGVGATSIFLHNRASTIYGGAREVQKNIIAKVAFGF
jgi:alkylation response protein AidB-like acyl-CoA dehydrogenase